MRIIVNAISANTGGIVTYTSNLIEYVSSSDIETIVYVPEWFDRSQFGDLDEYCEEVEGLAEAIKTLPKSDEVDEIMMPGERSDAIYEDRIRNGYIVPPKVWAKVVEVAEKYNVPLPAVG